MNRQVSVADVAEAVNLSPSRLRGLFILQVGLPPIQYIKSARIDKTKELLETSFLTVKQIAAHVGIDASHLVRYFKKVFGVTPTQHRMSRRLESSFRAEDRNLRTGETANK